MLKHQLKKQIHLIPYLFIIWISFLFVAQSYLVYGWWRISNSLLTSWLRDIFFWWVALITLIRYRAYLLSFLKWYRRLITPILILLILNSYYIIQSINSFQTIAGSKYDIMVFVILLVSYRFGYLISKTNSDTKFLQYTKRFLSWSLIIIVVGIFRQLAKNLVPGLFINYLGYSLPSDFVPYTNPPIYYLTWSWWIQRLSGLFNGPNVLGFFLILMASPLYFWIKRSTTKTKTILFVIFYILVSFLTLSRAALVWITLQYLCIFWYHYIIQDQQYRHQTRQEWTSKIITILWIIGLAFVLFQGMNYWKSDSNTERHWSWLAIQSILEDPPPLLGYGPGTVWPAQHYQDDYYLHLKNKNALVENTYLQILINQWRIGAALFAWIIVALIYAHYQIRKKTLKSSHSWYMYHITQHMGLWMFGLLCVAMFLHIFIDSMINYLFFTLYGSLIVYQLERKNRAIEQNKDI